VKRSTQPAALRARDDGMRRVRRITWRVAILAAAAATVAGGRFAHLSPSLPHLPGDLTSGGPSSAAQPGTTAPGSSSSSGIPPAGGGGQGSQGAQVTSGGS
jgi:hypothetical protein